MGASRTRVTTSASTVKVGQAVTIRATVTGSGPFEPTGHVTFKDGSHVIFTVPLSHAAGGSIHVPQAGASAQVSDTVVLPADTHVLSAVYSGDTNDRASAGGATVHVTTTSTGGDGPRVVGVSRLGYHEQPTTLVLTFNEALDPPRADDPASYRIVTIGGPGRGGKDHGRITPVASVDCTAGASTVVLRPARRLDMHNVDRLVVDGTSSHGLTDTAGRLMGGQGTAHPGSNFSTLITRQTLIKTPPPQIVDLLAASGTLTASRKR